MPPTRGKPLTDRQHEVWEAFKLLTARRGLPPSVRDVAAHFRIQVSAAHRHLRLLVRRGWLEARGGVVRLPGSSGVPVPIMGRVPAGAPRETFEVPEGYLPCPPDWGRGQDLFALRVRGDSMTDAGILDQDVVVVAKTGHARDGEIVVALVDGEATVKRLGKSGGEPALLPANPKYKPIVLQGEVRIAGKVLGVFRSLA
ncbi:MAG: transcriptional repressor LexA [Candidatus Coatesbacteria bacterium]